MKNKFLFLFLAAVVALVSKSYFAAGFPYTHDGENHLARFANYKIALKEGQFPPRFAPNLLNHYGYPVFNYNYPLANILSLPFSLLKLNYELSFKVIVIISLVVGAWGVFRYLKSLNFHTTSSIFSAVIWVSMPYMISLINFRGSIGEILAYALLPWTLWTIEKTNVQRYFFSWEFLASTGILSCFLLSHNITAVFAIPLLLFTLLFRTQGNRKRILCWLASFISSIALTVWFWLPALLEMKEVIVGQSTSNNDFYKFFPTLTQLLWSPIQFGFSYPGSVDSLSFQVGAAVLLSLFLVVALFLAERLQKKANSIPPIVYFSGVCILLLCFFQLSTSQVVWQLIPQAKFIQFPWRLSLFITSFALPLVAFSLESFYFKNKLLCITILVFAILPAITSRPVDFFHKNIVDYDAFSATTSTQNENLPTTFSYEDISQWQPGPVVSEQAVTALHSSKWSGSEHRFEIQVAEPTFVTERTTYFLGWQTTYTTPQQTQPQQLSYDLATSKGLLGYRLEPGFYTLTSKFTQKTPAREWGNGISLVSAIAFTALFLLRSKVVQKWYEKK